MRIALVGHTAAADAPTGAEHSLALLAAGLAGRGHEVHVVVPGPWALAARLTDAGVTVHRLAYRACWMTYWSGPSLPEAAAKAARCLADLRRAGPLARLIRRLAPDAGLVNCLPGTVGALAMGRARVPFVWHVREILPPGMRRRAFARLLARRPAAVVAVSEATAGWIREAAPGAAVEVVYNGAAVPKTVPEPAAARRRLGISPGGTIAGYVGQIVAHKGVGVFLEAARQLAATTPQARFLVAGPVHGAPPPGLDPPPPHVLHLPPQPDAADLIAACDVVCVPTLTPDPAPRVIMEAMAAGRPVVASASGGGEAELLGPAAGGLLVPPGSAGALAAAVSGLLRDPERRTTLASELRARAAELFSADRHLAAMEAVLVRTAGGAG